MEKTRYNEPDFNRKPSALHRYRARLLLERLHAVVRRGIRTGQTRSHQRVENAVKELDRRYDLKGKGTFEFKEKDLTVNLTAEADFQLEAMIEILKLALVKRKIDVQCLEVKDAYASGKLMKQEAVLKEGIDKELAKKIVAHVKDAKLKVQAAIQGEQVRITGKKRDDLQEAIAALRAKSFDMPLQFNNFRD